MRTRLAFPIKTARRLLPIVCLGAISVALLEERGQHDAAFGAVPARSSSSGARADQAGNDGGPGVKRWQHSFDEAVRAAGRLNVPLLVHFYADWCQPCRRMERDVLNDPALLRRFGTRLVAVKVNVDRNERVVRRFNVSALPSDVVVSPRGTVLSRSHGFQPKETYLDRLSAAEAQFQTARRSADDHKPGHSEKPRFLTAENSADPTPVASRPRKPWRKIAAQPAAESNASPKDDDDALPEIKSGSTRAGSEPGRVAPPEPPPLGLEGYCPVSLQHHRKWRKGDGRYSAVFKGIEYHMAGKDERRKFVRNPSHYAPRLLGCDPVLLWETDRAVPGSVRHAAYFQDELFLFLSDENRERFRKNPHRYARLRHVLRVKDIEPRVRR